MQKFIKHIISFFLFFATFCIVGFIVFDIIVSQKAKKFEIQSNVNRVFIGDSHIQKSVNDTYIENAINLGIRAEATFYSYYKLKYLIEHNANIKEVYLGFSYHNLSSYYDDFVQGQYSLTTSPKYFYLLPQKTKLTLLLHNFYHVSFYKSLIKVGMEIFKNKRMPYMGNYYNAFKNTAPQKTIIDKRIKAQYYNAEGKPNNFSETSIAYLQKIQNLCHKNNIAFYVLNTPLHSYYENNIPKKFTSKYHAVLSKNHIKTLSYNSLQFENEHFIPDGDHLSTEGAIIFSLYLNNLK